MADIRLPIVSASGDKCVCSTTCVEKLPVAFRVVADWDWGYYPMSMFVAGYYIDNAYYAVSNDYIGWYTEQNELTDDCRTEHPDLGEYWGNTYWTVDKYLPRSTVPSKNIKHYAPGYDTFDINLAALRKLYPKATEIALRFESSWYPGYTQDFYYASCWGWDDCYYQISYDGGNTWYCDGGDWRDYWYELWYEYITTDNTSVANITYSFASYDGVIGANGTSVMYPWAGPVTIGPDWTSSDFYIIIDLVDGYSYLA